jgi:peptidoglycan/xylan/chitin deacetylase (PgdA/CDA1 family)
MIANRKGIWRHGAQAAVSFTYDDGRESQLDVAALDLEEYNFRGTFFVTPKIYRVEQRAADWKWMTRVGHEVGNHSFTHNLDYPTPQDFEKAEVAQCEQWLNDHVLLDNERTYAYPEGDTKLKNGRDYADVLPGVMLAARTGGGGPATAEAAKLDQFRISAQACTWDHNSSDTSIDYLIEATTLLNGWCILIFHDVSDAEPTDASQTSRKVHREIIQHVSNSNSYWVAPFRDVFRYAVSH